MPILSLLMFLLLRAMQRFHDCCGYRGSHHGQHPGRCNAMPPGFTRSHETARIRTRRKRRHDSLPSRRRRRDGKEAAVEEEVVRVRKLEGLDRCCRCVVEPDGQEEIGRNEKRYWFPAGGVGPEKCFQQDDDDDDGETKRECARLLSNRGVAVQRWEAFQMIGIGKFSYRGCWDERERRGVVRMVSGRGLMGFVNAFEVSYFLSRHGQVETTHDCWR